MLRILTILLQIRILRGIRPAFIRIQSGALSHKSTPVQAHRSFRLLPLASYNYNFTIFLLYPIMWVWSKGILSEKPIIAEGIRYMGENEKKQMKEDLAVQEAVTFLVENAVEK